MEAAGRTARELTEGDLEILRWAADQRLFQAAQVQTLVGCTAPAALGRLRALTGHGLLQQHKVFHREPPAYTVTRSGLGLLGSTMAPARLDLASYAHDIGVGWAALAALRGAFGELSEVVSERQMRSRDTVLRADPLRTASERFAVRLGGFGPAGRERLHYPDLLLLRADSRRIAVEVELSAKGRTRCERILRGYAGERRIDAVVYLTDRPAIARSIEAAARVAGIPSLVHVQPFRWDGPVPGAAARTGARAVERTGARAVERAGTQAAALPASRAATERA